MDSDANDPTSATYLMASAARTIATGQYEDLDLECRSRRNISVNWDTILFFH